MTKFQKKLTMNQDNKQYSFKFIDLFAGIGGFRIGFESVGGKCVFSSDIDEPARRSYALNFNEIPSGDICKIKSEEIPDHDILCGGFPCQPFSIAGKRLGFAETRGTLFFEIDRILRDKKPKAFILENVRGLVNHDKGNTLKVILEKLKSLGYTTYFEILNSKDFGVPQNRERVYLVGALDKDFTFTFPPKTDELPCVTKILEDNVVDHDISDIAKSHIKKHLKETNKVFDHSKPIFATEIRPSRCVFRNDGLSPCLTAKMGTGGNNVPVLINEMRKLTVRECLRIQGFPDSFKLKENHSQSYKQVGNSISVPVVSLLAKSLVESLNSQKFK